MPTDNREKPAKVRQELAKVRRELANVRRELANVREILVGKRRERLEERKKPSRNGFRRPRPEPSSRAIDEIVRSGGGSLALPSKARAYRALQRLRQFLCRSVSREAFGVRRIPPL